MVTITITVFILLLVNFGGGVILQNIFKMQKSDFALTSLLGIMGITVLETLLAFFLPLNSIVEIVVMTVGLSGVVCFFFSKEKITFQPNFWFYFFATILIFSASFAPYLYDHFGYYVPTISCLREVGFVKGISNLDLLLGQTSFLHIYEAGFSHFTDPYLKINVYLSILFLIYIYERKQFFLLIFIPVLLLFVQQPSPDLPVIICTIIILNELSERQQYSILLLISLFAFCIKPVVFWLPLLVILNDIDQKKFTLKKCIPVALFGILLVGKNLWLFGFPVFPLAFFDFNLPWKPSQEVLTYSSQVSLMKSYDMKYAFQQVSQFGFLQRIYHWFTIGYKSVFNMGIIASLLIIALVAFKKKTRFYYLLLFCLILKTAVILSFSAQYRFFIDVYVVAVFLLIQRFSEEKTVFIWVFASVLILVVFSFPEFLQQYKMGRLLTGFSVSQLYKPNTIKSEKNKRYKLGNLTFNVSKNIGDKVKFPALGLYDLKLYDYYGIFPQYSGTDVRNGFCQRKLKPDEKLILKKIIAETEKSKR